MLRPSGGLLSATFLFLLLLAQQIRPAQCRYSCKDLDGRSVDWFVAYKLPEFPKSQAGTELPGIRQGHGFLYADANSPLGWKMSRKEIDDDSTAIGATISQYYRGDSAAFRFAYSDDGPTTPADSYRGHAKGVVTFDHQTGFWLVHSVPNYPPLRSYSYPHTAVKYAQSFMCVTLSTDDLEHVGQHLLYAQATPFDYNLPPDFATRFVVLRTIAQKKSLPSSATVFTHKRYLKTAAGAELGAFSKHKKFNQDIWLRLVAAETNTKLGVQSWLNGNADDLHSQCDGNIQALDVDTIRVLNFTFSSSKDHSKWAVSDSPSTPIVCVGDMNRQRSQLRRGGGALCILNRQLWQTYKNSVAHIEPCTNGGAHFSHRNTEDNEFNQYLAGVLVFVLIAALTRLQLLVLVA